MNNRLRKKRKNHEHSSSHRSQNDHHDLSNAKGVISVSESYLSNHFRIVHQKSKAKYGVKDASKESALRELVKGKRGPSKIQMEERGNNEESVNWNNDEKTSS